jgi:hypothetical protein
MRTSNIQELMQFINNKRSEYIFALHFFLGVIKHVHSILGLNPFIYNPKFTFFYSTKN